MDLKETHYELVDFGAGRKLESFGGRLVDRPSPAALEFSKRQPARWSQAISVFETQERAWHHRDPWPSDDTLDCGEFRMPISPTPFGHVGVFPEQRVNWDWISKTAPQASGDLSGLNLFGYTGASSIAMAMTGMKVAHVDAAKPNVATARSAAALNSLADHPIRYLVDDAAKFAAREVRRGNLYHTIVLDPPAYGHSPKGKTWRLERDLWPLIDSCLNLLDTGSYRLLITGHSPQVRSADVVDYLLRHTPKRLRPDETVFRKSIQSGRLSLIDGSERKLDAGFFVRCRPFLN